MKQGFKSWYRATLLLAIAFFMLSGMSITSKAVEYDKAVELILINKKMTKMENIVTVGLDVQDDHISNVRTSSKHLKAWIVETGDKTYRNNFERMRLFATKKGTYWLKFDVVDNGGKYKSTEKARVIVCDKRDSYKAFKSIKIGNTNLLKNLFKDDYTTKCVTVKKGGKLKVKMNKGCKLIDITVGRYVFNPNIKTNSDYYKEYVEYETKTVKNGSKIKLAEVGYDYQTFERKGNQIKQHYEGIFGYTYLKFTYRDKNGNERTSKITVRSKLK